MGVRTSLYAAALSVVATAMTEAAWTAGAAAQSAAPAQTLTVDRIYASPSLTGTPPRGIRWLPDSKGVTYTVTSDDETRLVMASVPKGEEQVLCVADTITVPDDLGEGPVRMGSLQWAEVGDLGLFTWSGEVFTFDRKTGEVVRRTRSEVREANVFFAPDARKIAFTREHDLWLLDLENGSEVQATTTGSDTLLNGVLDWVYMEELFTRGDVRAHWWSPDGGAIAYLQINESPVPEFAIVDFAPLHNTAELQHYPKAGDPIPIVRVGVYDVAARKTTWMDVDTSDNSYIARVYWLGDSRHLAIEKINRAQDDLQLLFADAGSGETREIIRERKDTWVNVTYNKHYYLTKDRFIWNSDRDGNSHLYLYDNEGNLLSQVTKGPWEVYKLDDVDEKHGRVFFTGLEHALIDRHVYTVSERGGRLKRLTSEDGTHSATFAPDHKHFIDRFSSASTPTTITVRSSSSGKVAFALHTPDTSELEAYDLPQREFMRITASNGLEYQCEMIKPRDFDAAGKYPVLIFTYGGPHRQVVQNAWGGTRYLWHAMMAERGYIIFSLDNRGSWGRGTAWEDPLLEKMGHVELEDQLLGVEYLKSLPYVDGDRIGIWGWSYGGYMTAIAMFKAPGVFKCGASIAPVSDWHFYDAIYTERYMKDPTDNADGYEASAPLNFVDGLEAPFFLAHGTADDNVHVQNTVRLTDELIKADKDFELMLYPGKYHGISGRAARTHLFKRLTRFFEDNL